MVTIGNIACSALPGPVCSVANIGKEGCTSKRYVAFILFRDKCECGSSDHEQG